MSLRIILADDNGRLFTRLFEDGCFPKWSTPPEGRLAKVVVDASPEMEVEYEIEATGERRRLRTPPYRHAVVVDALRGIAKSGPAEFAVLSNADVWMGGTTVDVANWLKQPLFEVDGLIYDLVTTIKTVADKEGAHIDPVVESEGIYTGSRTVRTAQPSNHDLYVRSRLVRFGPFSYPHIVVLCVARYLVAIAKASLTRYAAEVGSLAGQISLARVRRTAIRDRMAIIHASPSIGRIGGLPLHVLPERLVMRPPISMGLGSSDDDQRRADALPQYGETLIGAVREMGGE